MSETYSAIQYKRPDIYNEKVLSVRTIGPQEATPPMEFITGNVANHHYDFYLVTSNDIPWKEDPLRQNKHSRDKLMEMNIAEVRRTGRPFQVITGKESERLRMAVGAIDAQFA